MVKMLVSDCLEGDFCVLFAAATLEEVLTQEGTKHFLVDTLSTNEPWFWHTEYGDILLLEEGKAAKVVAFRKSPDDEGEDTPIFKEVRRSRIPSLSSLIQDEIAWRARHANWRLREEQAGALPPIRFSIPCFDGGAKVWATQASLPEVLGPWRRFQQQGFGKAYPAQHFEGQWLICANQEVAYGTPEGFFEGSWEHIPLINTTAWHMWRANPDAYENAMDGVVTHPRRPHRKAPQSH